MQLTPTLECWLRLSRAPGVGSATLLTLLESFDSPENIVGASHAQLRGCVGDDPALLDGITAEPDPAQHQSDLEWLQQDESTLLTILDPVYPPLLR